MSILQFIFGTKPTTPTTPVNDCLLKTSGDFITEISGGANLVEGTPTWEHAESDKNNLEVMLECCSAELETMQKTGFVAAPFYFERAAILLRKGKQYKREIEICTNYIKQIEQHYASIPKGSEADVRKGPRFKAIKERIKKTKILQSKASR